VNDFIMQGKAFAGAKLAQVPERERLKRQYNHILASFGTENASKPKLQACTALLPASLVAYVRFSIRIHQQITVRHEDGSTIELKQTSSLLPKDCDGSGDFDRHVVSRHCRR